MLRLTGDQQLLEELSTDYRLARTLESGDRAMLEYVAKLVTAPWETSSEQVERLREHGFSDRAILETNLVASYMSFVNRLAQGLGVELEEYFTRFTR